MKEKKYTVRVTKHARQSIRQISGYIRNELQAPEASVRWASRLKEAIRSLSSFPDRIALTPEEPWHGLGVHRMTHEKFYVYFMIFDDQSLVRVIDVIYQRRDQVNALVDIMR